MEFKCLCGFSPPTQKYSGCFFFASAGTIRLQAHLGHDRRFDLILIHLYNVFLTVDAKHFIYCGQGSHLGYAQFASWGPKALYLLLVQPSWVHSVDYRTKTESR